jgi:hypothetical protein
LLFIAVIKTPLRASASIMINKQIILDQAQILNQYLGLASPEMAPTGTQLPEPDQQVLANSTENNQISNSVRDTDKAIASVTQSRKTFPAVLEVRQPKPAPAIPGKPFTPPVPQTTGINTPEIAEWTRTAGPDESVVLTGINFTKATRFMVYAHDSIKEATMQSIFPDRAIITLPKEMPRYAMYLVWPVNEAGYGYPVAINKT